MNYVEFDFKCEFKCERDGALGVSPIASATLLIYSDGIEYLKTNISFSPNSRTLSVVLPSAQTS